MAHTTAVTWFLIAVLICEVSSANAQPEPGSSARRDPNVSYKVYLQRADTLSRGALAPGLVPGKSAVDVAVAYKKARLPRATAWESDPQMQSRFRQFRDLRFLSDGLHPGFARRSSWLYPDDGCFARAALAVRNLRNRFGAAVPSKIFVFGDLVVRTQNALGGAVSWWYHVAPLVEVEGRKYVLDPAIEPRAPLRLVEWLSRMSATPQELEVSVCGSGTYTPYDECDRATDGHEARAEADQMSFLDLEWNRLVELGRDPHLELGENPPWN